MNLSDDERKQVVEHLKNRKPFPLELEKTLREKVCWRPRLDDAHIQQLEKCLAEGAPLSPELEAGLVGTSPSIELEKLKSLGDYTKFHLGLYMTLLAAIIAFLTSDLGPALGSHASIPFLVTVLLLAFAGACGGMVGSNIPDHSSLIRFENAPLKKLLFRFKGKTWISLEHWFFWIGMVTMLLGLAWFARERSLSVRQSEVATIFEICADAWSAADMATVAALWVEEGQLKSQSGEAVHGRSQILKRLSENRRGAERPFALTDREVRYTDANHAIVYGNARFNIRGKDGRITPASDRFATFLAKTKKGWTIHTWLWLSADPVGSYW